ncbi:hypothetical protein [Halobacillus sp. Marseille-Q1614]|uniref:hypothetical protein n=1 Tax=Halobacillus sp. Marseille-Q1614 TaxID=2709134 RepID=UPI00156E1068|nr:hypothetical protein [Halobacillus sp. Marseille-Q1614]
MYSFILDNLAHTSAEELFNVSHQTPSSTYTRCRLSGCEQAYSQMYLKLINKLELWEENEAEARKVIHSAIGDHVRKGYRTGIRALDDLLIKEYIL